MKLSFVALFSSLALVDAFTAAPSGRSSVPSSLVTRHIQRDKPLYHYVPEPEEWNEEELEDLLREFNELVYPEDGTFTPAAAAFKNAVCEVCNPVLTPEELGEFWLDFKFGRKQLDKDFWYEWVKFPPTPADSSSYIENWDHLANTAEGRKYLGEDSKFRTWFVKFLDLHGKWINTPDSATTLAGKEGWIKYGGTHEHPFDIKDFIYDEDDPNGGYETFNQFFLRNIKRGKRPLDRCAKIVAPCDGGAFFLQKENTLATEHVDYRLTAKSNDRFNLEDAVPGYGKAFVGGSLIDILLWFTDYHYFHCPVDGEVVHVGDYAGSYNYDFDNYDPTDPYAPKPPGGGASDRVDWYNDLGKHKRVTFVFKTEDMGLVAMIPVGFWGVGSVIKNPDIKPGCKVKKGDFLGHFGYGGSSIALAFEPGQDVKFLEDFSNADNPRLIKVREGIGTKQTEDEKYYKP